MRNLIYLLFLLLVLINFSCEKEKPFKDFVPCSNAIDTNAFEVLWEDDFEISQTTALATTNMMAPIIFDDHLIYQKPFKSDFKKAIVYKKRLSDGVIVATKQMRLLSKYDCRYYEGKIFYKDNFFSQVHAFDLNTFEVTDYNISVPVSLLDLDNIIDDKIYILNFHPTTVDTIYEYEILQFDLKTQNLNQVFLKEYIKSDIESIYLKKSRLWNDSNGDLMVSFIEKNIFEEEYVFNYYVVCFNITQNKQLFRIKIPGYRPEDIYVFSNQLFIYGADRFNTENFIESYDGITGDLLWTKKSNLISDLKFLKVLNSKDVIVHFSYGQFEVYEMKSGQSIFSTPYYHNIAYSLIAETQDHFFYSKSPSQSSYNYMEIVSLEKESGCVDRLFKSQKIDNLEDNIQCFSLDETNKILYLLSSYRLRALKYK